MSIEKEAAGKRRLTKFDSTPWLSTGIAASLLLFGLDLWALLTQISKAFVPYQVSEILGMAIALALGIHCGDMIGYYRKHGKLKQ
jgi:hypothetical protein